MFKKKLEKAKEKINNITVEIRDEGDDVLTEKELKEKIEKIEVYIKRAKIKIGKHRGKMAELIMSDEQKQLLDQGEKLYNLKADIESDA